MTQGNRAAWAFLGGIVALGLMAGPRTAAAQKAGVATVELGSSYAEWKQPGALVVDGQRVVANAATKFKGKFPNLDAVPRKRIQQLACLHGPSLRVVTCAEERGHVRCPPNVVPLCRERRYPCYRTRPSRARRSSAAAAC